jgi:hypothetical protein
MHNQMLSEFHLVAMLNNIQIIVHNFCARLYQYHRQVQPKYPHDQQQQQQQQQQIYWKMIT